MSASSKGKDTRYMFLGLGKMSKGDDMSSTMPGQKGKDMKEYIK